MRWTKSSRQEAHKHRVELAVACFISNFWAGQLPSNNYSLFMRICDTLGTLKNHEMQCVFGNAKHQPNGVSDKIGA
jgi:hypothetical protein